MFRRSSPLSPGFVARLQYILTGMHRWQASVGLVTVLISTWHGTVTRRLNDDQDGRQRSRETDKWKRSIGMEPSDSVRHNRAGGVHLMQDEALSMGSVDVNKDYEEA